MNKIKEFFKKNWFPFLIMVLLVAVDQGIKELVKANLSNPRKEIVLIPNFIKLIFETNDGAAFSSFSGNLVFLIVMTFIGLGMFVYLYKGTDFKNKKCYSWGIILCLAGLFGNFIDRIFRSGKVIDYMYFELFQHHLFTNNFADDLLTVGVILFGIDVLIFESKRKKIAAKGLEENSENSTEKENSNER